MPAQGSEGHSILRESHEKATELAGKLSKLAKEFPDAEQWKRLHGQVLAVVQELKRHMEETEQALAKHLGAATGKRDKEKEK
jgi:hypothetical protein